MRITFISPANMSGGVRVIAIYAKALRHAGHDVRVISPPAPAMPNKLKLKSWVRGRGWPPASGSPKSHLDLLGVDHRFIEHRSPIDDADVPDGDVVIATWWETAELVAKLSNRKGAKVYFIQHHEVFEYLPRNRVEATYRLPLHKIVIADWLKRLMREQYDDEIVDVVPNSVDRSQFFAPVRGKQEAPTIGFLYSTTPFKALDLTSTAITFVRSRLPSLRVISFGSEPPNSQLPLPKATEFHYLPCQDRIRNLYASCDVWVTASRSEGFNLPAMEAMACRAPVVSTRTGWPEEVIKTGWNGVLVDVDDISGLARGVEWVLSQPDEEWRTLSLNAYATAASGSWHQSAALFEKALIHACRRAANGEIAGECTLGLGFVARAR